ncbi:MAG: metal ABC transporter ATP-binding protein [Nitrososphaerota archaeon]|nr:metal ABC transporter ATP-binding protein [Nitrososphaerota archaeon]
MAEPVLVFDNVAVSYVRGEEAVSNVTFSLSQREVAFLLGPNGGGKSTILKTVVGSVRPSRGTVKVFGVDVRSFKDWWRIGYLPQNAATLFERMPISVEEFLSASKVVDRGLTPVDALRLVGVASPMEFLRKRIHDLSGGNLQRVILAASLVNRPELLLLDEPTVYIDQGGVTAFIELLERLRNEWSLSAIIATHDVAALSTVASRVICVNRGALFDGHISDLVNSEQLCRIYGFHVYLVRHGH